MVAGLGRTPAYLQSGGLGIGLPGDENKKRELEEILRTLALKPGRISIEGIERLAKRLGYEIWQEPNKDGGQTVSITGAIIVVDIDFIGNNITQVALSFANTLGTSNDLAPQAASILRDNLQPERPLMISDLADFANNLERLSKLDKLSQAHALNCFTAITGLYESLSRIYEHEKTVMDGGAVEAMCRGNGRPRMHCNGKVGLSVEYWKERRKMPTWSSSKGKERDVAMDKGKTWRVIIEIDELGAECASLDTVRTSENWVGKNTIKPSDDSMFGDDDYIIDWVDPEPSVENLMEVDSARPNARFIARLDPPIVIPLLDEVTIFSSLGLYSPPGQIGATTLDGLLFHRALVPDLRPLTTERKIYLPPHMDLHGRVNPSVNHRYTLHTLKPIYAREVWEIPFGHPRQLGPIFQIFRQYVLLATLLRSCFSSHPTATNSSSGASTTSPLPQPQPKQVQTPPFTPDDLDSFLSTPTPEPPTGSMPIDISLFSDPPTPTLRVIFPSHVVPQRLISLEIEVSRNGGVAARYSIVDSPEQVARQGGVAGMGRNGLVGEDVVARAVEVTEDVGMTVEWLRRIV
ncbi:mediator of RNA polymerase II transcription subunit 1-domain-containing protein [Tirmania nivea]|nr:mediator of RNA polymerase II transcription subunit 1-domain-containing protein [Tirmania nivea]